MARKFSKFSRAARRGEVESGEARDLAKLPAAEPNATKKSLIRKTITNEILLRKKMENKKMRKIRPKALISLKGEKSKKFEGKLSTKIEQAVARASYVQTLRKADWALINKDLQRKVNKDSLKLSEDSEPTEQDLEDAYVEQFFESDNEKEAPRVSQNKFSILDEVEA